MNYIFIQYCYIAYIFVCVIICYILLTSQSYQENIVTFFKEYTSLIIFIEYCYILYRSSSKVGILKKSSKDESIIRKLSIEEENQFDSEMSDNGGLYMYWVNINFYRF